MTITSGRRPSDSIDAEQVERLGAAAGLAHDVDVGLAVEEREQPAAHDLVVVHDQHVDGVVRPTRHRQPPSGSARDADAHDRPRARCARDRDSPADLGGTAPHRLQAEVAGMAGVRIEAAPVVADLEHHLPRPGRDPNVRRARPGVPLDIRERLAPDGEQLRLHLLGRLPAGPRGPRTSMLRPSGRVRPLGVPRESGNEPVVHLLAAQLEDQRANLALDAPREVRDRAERSSHAPRGCAPSCASAFSAARVWSTVENRA